MEISSQCTFALEVSSINQAMEGVQSHVKVTWQLFQWKSEGITQQNTILISGLFEKIQTHFHVNGIYRVGQKDGI